jgi:branched-chain amino acid transport system ATP-binding protein
MLKVENLLHSYGGLTVLPDVSFSIEPGERVGLIGPNGAGKTTLLNILSGVIRHISGRIYFLDKDVTKLPAYKRASLGIGRSFQINALFHNLSLLDNVRLAIQGTKASRFQMLRTINSYGDILEEAKALLGSVHLWEWRHHPINTLPHGKQRQLEILLALASKPKLLLMDEPNAGLTSGETVELSSAIRSLVGYTTVLFCAHDMDLVFSLADRVIVLHIGQIIAHGTPEEIRANPEVREIYLGTENEDTRTS